MPATPDTTTPETVLAFDFGLRRIGVAAGQTVTGSASPVGVVPNSGSGPDWRLVEDVIREWRPTRLIVGMPRNADDSASAITVRVIEFCNALQHRFSLPVDTVDERHSSIEAERLLTERRKAGSRGRIRRETVDAAAATLIAERWLRHER